MNLLVLLDSTVYTTDEGVGRVEPDRSRQQPETKHHDKRVPEVEHSRYKMHNLKLCVCVCVCVCVWCVVCVVCVYACMFVYTHSERERESVCVCVCVWCVCVWCVCMHACLCIHIQRERERERERVLMFAQLWREPLVCRVNSFVLLYVFALTFVVVVVVYGLFVVALYISSAWFVYS